MVLFRTQLLQHFQPGHAREHQVQRNGVKVLGSGQIQPTQSVASPDAFVAGLEKALLQGFSDQRVVFHNQQIHRAQLQIPMWINRSTIRLSKRTF